LDGLAIVSAIMAADDPKATCQQFADIIQASKQPSVNKDVTAEAVIKYAIQAMKNIKSKGPMVHHITSMCELLM
jgi:thiamine-phosphate diphosphorylase/hydroxyethylthiazole kinase